MTPTEICCPTCSERGKIEISKEAIKDVARGLLAINIPADTICSHSFIVYVDKNLDIRDYFVADFQIELPQIAPPRMKEKPGLLKDIFDVDLIKLNLSATLLTYILKSILSNKKIIVISDQDFLFNHIHKFFDYITKDSFTSEISLMTKEEYKKNKKNYKDFMVFEGNNILNNVDKLINPKKIFVEKQIISSFVISKDLGYGYIFLKNEVFKAFKFAQSIVEYIEKETDKEKINILKISANLENVFETKINTLYVNFLIEIVRNYFDIKILSVSESFLDLF